MSDALPPAPDSNAPAPRKKTMWIILAIVAGIGVLGLSLCGGAVYMLSKSPEFREAMEAIVSMADRPGSEELRAAGCETALIMDMRTFVERARQNPDVDKEQLEVLDDPVLVVCTVPDVESAPDCSQLAKVYIGAIEEVPDTFSLFVSATDVDEPLCAGSFDNEGRRKGEPPALQLPAGHPFEVPTNGKPHDPHHGQQPEASETPTEEKL